MTSDFDHQSAMFAQTQNGPMGNTLLEALLWAHEAIAVIDAGHKFTFVNKSFTTLSGYPAAELLDQPASLVLKDGYHDATFFNRIWDTVARGITWDGFVTSRRKNGTVFHQALTVRPVSDGVTTEYVVLARDVTEERLTQDALKQALRDLRRVIDKTPDGYALIRDGRYVYMNAAWAKMLGVVESVTLVGSQVSSLVHTDDGALLSKALTEAPTGSPRDLRFRRPDGSYALTEFVPVEVIGFEGQPTTLVIGRDISSRKQIQSQLMLSDRMASLGTLAAGVAHEINNPLAYVIANLQYVSDWFGVLMSHGGVDEATTDVRDALDDAREGVDRVRRVVGDLKSYTRADDQRHKLELKDVVDTAIKLAWNEIRYRAQFTRDYGETPVVEASEARVVQLVVNLLVNAAQAVDDSHPFENEISVRIGTSPSGDALIEVSDSGPGIPESTRARIFDPFFTTKPVGKGTGLGLSICHTIVTSLDGEITFSSELGVGTTFRVVLPAGRRGSRKLRRRRSRPVTYGGPSGRILIIDDEEAILKALRRALVGHEVFTANNGHEAIEIIYNSEPFDVLLCDLNMPDTTGMDVYDEVCDNLPAMKDRFVFMTGGAFTDRSRDFLDEVHNPRLEKPFDVQKVVDLMSKRVQLRTRFNRAIHS